MVDNFLADSEANPGTRIFCSIVKALKQEKNPFKVFRCNANAIVAYMKYPFAVLKFCAYLHTRRIAAAKLESIADQILKELSELRAIRIEHRQGAANNIGPMLFNDQAEIGQCLVKCYFCVCLGKGRIAGVDAGQHQEIIDDRLHACGAIHRITNEFISILIQFSAIALSYELSVTRHHAQRLL